MQSIPGCFRDSLHVFQCIYNEWLMNLNHPLWIEDHTACKIIQQNDRELTERERERECKSKALWNLERNILECSSNTLTSLHQSDVTAELVSLVFTFIRLDFSYSIRMCSLTFLSRREGLKWRLYYGYHGNDIVRIQKLPFLRLVWGSAAQRGFTLSK